MIACVCPEATLKSTPLRISVTSSPSPTVTCRSRISRVAIRLVVLTGWNVTGWNVTGWNDTGWNDWGETQSGLDHRHDLVLQLGQADPLHDIGEEPPHDKSSRLVLGNAP